MVGCLVACDSRTCSGCCSTRTRLGGRVTVHTQRKTEAAALMKLGILDTDTVVPSTWKMIEELACSWGRHCCIELVPVSEGSQSTEALNPGSLVS